MSEVFYVLWIVFWSGAAIVGAIIFPLLLAKWVLK